MSLIEIDIPSQVGKNVDQRRRLLSEPPSLPENFPTHEQLLAMTLVEQFREPTRRLLEHRYPPEEAALGMIGFDVMAAYHAGRMRKHEDAEEGTHPAFVGLWHIMLHPKAPVDQYTAAAGHDILEDTGENPEGLYGSYVQRGYPAPRAARVTRGVFGLTRDDGDYPDKQAAQIAYLDKIARIGPEIRELEIEIIKPVDAAHTVIRYMLDVLAGKNALKAEGNRDDKANLVLGFALTHAPEAASTRALEHAIGRLNGALAAHHQREQMATRRNLTPRVPA